MTDGQRSLKALVHDLQADAKSLAAAEQELAKVEAKSTAKHVGAGVGIFVAAGVLALVAFVLLSVAAAQGLVALGLPAWASYLIVSVVYLIIVAILIKVGKGQVEAAKGLERTQRTLRETAASLLGTPAA